MKNKAFTQLLIQLEKLTFSQSKKAEEYLHNKCTIENIEDSIGTAESCPYCYSNSFHKWGVHSGLQRYRCKECHKGERNLDHKPRKRGGKASQRGLSSGQTLVLIIRDREVVRLRIQS